MKVTNNMRLPQAFVEAVSVERHNKPGCYSATTLNKGTKEIILQERHWDDLTVDAADNVWAVFGTAVHKIFESKDPSFLIALFNEFLKAEDITDEEVAFCKRMLAKVKSGVETESTFAEEKFDIAVSNSHVTGCVDSYDMEHGEIFDWKTASVFKVMKGDFSDWYRQGMTYAWLLTQNGFEVRLCRFIALLKDHSKSKAKTESGYPQSPVFIYEFDVTPEELEATGKRITDKIREIEYAETLADDEIEECSIEERWADPDKWAVMKEGRKTAVRVFDNEEQANLCKNQLGDNHYIEHRPAVSRKCADYCLCKNFCNFYKSQIKGE